MENLMDKDWKILIVLDACRYDYFKKVYKKYFKGKLKKKKSIARKTIQWLYKTFPNEYEDLVYISANPFINSKMTMYYKKKPINSKEKFFKVVNTWDWGWDEKFGTTPPDKVNSDFFKYYKKYPNKRFILHYMQPHMPYIPLLKRDDLINGEFDKDKALFFFKYPAFKEFLYKFFPPPILKLARKLRSKLFTSFREVQKSTDFKVILENYSLEKLRSFYMENLEFVLKHVSEVVDSVEEKIIITADHGELLGEHGLFGHAIEDRYVFKNSIEKKIKKNQYKELLEIPEFYINY